ncbi:hypothetical protein I553_2816 [Mycobacterium xenopi 4042]|uniref:Uncharacterized protein n=1 Tax=Mycobacterium xenopi 4042 TaxID=1299334 RepID=X8EYF0_MYCXE|nr:hypothetical protein I553_2816 [Mycobacterium xenopi 4042]
MHRSRIGHGCVDLHANLGIPMRLLYRAVVVVAAAAHFAYLIYVPSGGFWRCAGRAPSGCTWRPWCGGWPWSDGPPRAR